VKGIISPGPFFLSTLRKIQNPAFFYPSRYPENFDRFEVKMVLYAGIKIAAFPARAVHGLLSDYRQ